MNRFIVKASFNTPSQLESAKDKLLALGVQKSDIDYLSSPRTNGEGLKFETTSKAPFLAIKLIIPSMIAGVFAYYLSLFKTTNLDFFGVLLSTDFSSLLFAILIFGFVGLVIGYLWGRHYDLHIVIFKKKNGESSNIMMAVSTPYEKIKIIKKSLKQFTNQITITDAHAEVEAGLRAQ